MSASGGGVVMLWDLEDLFDYVCSVLLLSRIWFRCGQTDRMGFKVIFDR